MADINCKQITTPVTDNTPLDCPIFVQDKCVILPTGSSFLLTDDGDDLNEYHIALEEKLILMKNSISLKEPSLGNPAADGYILTSTAAGVRSWIPNLGGGSGGHIIQDEDSNLPQRTYLNFVGTGVSVVDNSVTDSTIVTVTSGGLNSLVEDTTPQLGGNLDRNGFQISGLVIGTDVQAYSPVLQNTTASFTTTLNTKLSSIEPNAKDDQLASEVPFTPYLTITSTNVQLALQELKDEVDSVSGGGISDGDKGDITVTGGGVTWTIDDNAITTSKLSDSSITNTKVAVNGLLFDRLPQIAEATILGRPASSGTGNLSALTAAQIRTIINVENGATGDQSAVDVPVTDAGGNYTATNVETVLAEIYTTKAGISLQNTFTGINHFNSAVTSGDSGFFIGENEGVSGIRWRALKNQVSDKLELGTQDTAATTYSGAYTTRYTLDDSGTPVDGTDLITKSYADANYLVGTDNLGNHIATQDLNMAENNIINSGIIYVNGTATTANDFVIGRSNTGSYFYDEESYNSVTLGRFDINATTGAGVYLGDFDALGTLTQAGAPVIVSDITGITGAAVVSNWVSVSQAEYDAIVTPDPNTVYYIEDAIDYSTPISSTATAIDMGYWGGNYVSMASANTATSYTTTNPQLGGWAKVRINAASQPTVTGATLITGSTFAPSTDMYMYVTYNGTTTEYWFEEI